jgi:alkaline phosphatase
MRYIFTFALLTLFQFHCLSFSSPVGAQEKKESAPEIVPRVIVNDPVASMQQTAMVDKTASWGHWGNRPKSYSAWTNHSNRLIPVYVFGGSFAEYMNDGSTYRDEAKIEKLYGRLPPNTFRSDAPYADQTDVYRLQRKAIEQLGKKFVFLVVFDGMDWQTTQAAAIYKSGKVYTSGKGEGLIFQDYKKCSTDYGFYVSSPYGDEVETDVDAQLNLKPVAKFGGYDSRLAGTFPWEPETDVDYPIGRSKISTHAYTDSSSSATSLTTGVKAINGAVNLDHEQGFSAGAVTSVPISHATPAAAYAANVSRDDYQDLTRDMIGLPSVARKSNPSPGLEVVIGCGYGEETEKPTGQGNNFVPGNRYLADEDRTKVDIQSNGPYSKYVVAQRTPGKSGSKVLSDAAALAASKNQRLLGFFGVKGGHLPFQTANGDFQPVMDVKEKVEEYSQADIDENPTLAEMTQAALVVLQKNDKGFWLMVEAGDVDWANHANNIDSSIGAVLSGDAAIRSIFSWIEQRNAWNESLVVVTADHGHYLHLVQPEALVQK